MTWRIIKCYTISSSCSLYTSCFVSFRIIVTDKFCRSIFCREFAIQSWKSKLTSDCVITTHDIRYILVVRSSLFVTTGRWGWCSTDQNIFSRHDHSTVFISLLQSVQNVFAGHVSFSLQVPGTFSQGIKRPEHEADHQLTYIPRLGMSGILPSLPNWFVTLFCPCKHCTIPMVYERVGNETRNHKTAESHAFVYVMSRKSGITSRLRLFQLRKAGLLCRIHG